MPKLNWKSYEELVKDIYEQLGKASGVKILGYGKDCKYMGKSEVEHQISQSRCLPFLENSYIIPQASAFSLPFSPHP